MIRRPPRSTLSSSSAASDVYKRQCTYTPEETPSLWSYEEHRSEKYPESDLQSPCQFTSSTSTLVDDNIFSLFVRSPPRDETLSGLETLNEPPALADESKTKVCSTALTRNDLSTEMASYYESQSRESSSVGLEPYSELRIRLHVKPPKPEIRLRMSIPM